MFSDTSVSAINIGKSYQVYRQPQDRLKQFIFPTLRRIVGMRQKCYYEEFWALKDVSFSISKGRITGVIGKNGAGKSTLLQILCGKLSASQGELRVVGRVAALLELGAGFNPEFTGIENVYMNAQILGFTREQVDARLSDILAFADIGDFVYQPVKTYSSGMFARLAFSVVIHVEPDILIVDEALSVGDAWFQHKSMARMRQLMESGCTVLFVSHSIEAVRALCHEVIWLEAGQIKMIGNVTEVTNSYMNDVFIEQNRITLSTANKNLGADKEVSGMDIADDVTSRVTADAQKIESAAFGLDGGAVLELLRIRLKDKTGRVVECLDQGERFSMEFDFRFLQDVKHISVGIAIRDHFGQELTGESFFNSYRHSLDFAPGQTATFAFSSTMLLRGGQTYSVALRVSQVSKWDRSDNIYLYVDELAMVFDVIEDPQSPMWFFFRMPFDVACT